MLAFKFDYPAIAAKRHTSDAEIDVATDTAED